MEILDKIIVSPTAPSSKNVAWFDGKSIKIHSKGKWENASESSGGGGNEEGNNISKMVNVTYEELVNLRDNNKLVPGAKYRMIDYETYTSKANTQSAGHLFDLILTALDEKTLDEKCSAIQSERDTDGYFANSNLAAWDVRYCLDNSKKYEWSAHGGTTIYVSYEGITMSGYFNGQTEIFNDKTYYQVVVGAEGESSILLSESNNPNVGDTLYFVFNNKIQLEMPISAITKTVKGKGVIYRMIDEHNNDLPFDFKNIKQKTVIENTDYTEYYYTFDDSGIDGSLKGNNFYNNKFCCEGYLPNIIFMDLCHDNYIINVLSMLCDSNFYSNIITNTVYNLYISNGFSDNICICGFNNVKITGSIFNCLLKGFWTNVKNSAHISSSIFGKIQNVTIKKYSQGVIADNSSFEFSNIMASSDSPIEIVLSNYNKNQKYRVFYLNNEIKVMSDEDIYNAIQANQTV